MKIVADPNVFSLGIALTNKCNLNCPHCYSRSLPQSDLEIADVDLILKKFPNLKKINFGTGESIFNKNFVDIIKLLREKRVEMALTTNGLTVDKIEEKYLGWFKEIDFSLDFPDRVSHDKWRGSSGVFGRAIRGIERCKKKKVDVSIVLCLMRNNYKRVPEFRKLIDRYKVFLRINLYKPITDLGLFLSYEEFWQAMKLISENFTLVSNSEPILSIVTGDRIEGSPCGSSLRIHPNLIPSPCVYLGGVKVSVDSFREQKKIVPYFCRKCDFIRSCRGGCLGRRYLTTGPEEPDIYCPFVKGDPVPKIVFKRCQEKREFIHNSYLCTVIVK